VSFLDQDRDPFPDEIHRGQLQDLLSVAPGGGKSILDLGAGSGRVALPLCACEHEVLAIDNDPEAATILGQQDIETIVCDFLKPGWDAVLGDRRFDLILMLGNTFMLVHEIDAALRLFEGLHPRVRDEGSLVLDAIPQLHWSEVADGYWVNGINEERGEVFRWAPDDNVFALRDARAAHADDPALHDSDRLHRLWTRGELELLARATGWNSPRLSPSGTLLFFEKA
jgi:SAM-dependent methyltransferase